MDKQECINSCATDVLFEVVSPAPVSTEPMDKENEDQNDEERAVEEKEEKAMEEKEEEETKAMRERDGEIMMTAIERKEAEEESKPIKIAKSSKVMELKAKLLEKEKELENLSAENESLKKKAEVSENAMATVRAKEEELGVKLSSTQKELRKSQAKAESLEEKLEAVEGAKAVLEAEMKRLRVQTEQWRKAAEAAATVLAIGEGPEVEMVGGRRVAERCSSMDKNLVAGGGGFTGWGSPLIGGEMDKEGIVGGKRRGVGSRGAVGGWVSEVYQPFGSIDPLFSLSLLLIVTLFLVLFYLYCFYYCL